MTLTTLRTHRTRLKMRRVAVGLPEGSPRGEGGRVARAEKEGELPARASSVFSRSVERSETYGLQASPSVVSRQGIIHLAPR